MTVSQGLVSWIVGEYRLPETGIHGLAHWARVLETGRELADHTGARRDVVELFAVLHDACRLNENHDPLHDARSTELAGKLRDTFFTIDEGMQWLEEACRDHTAGRTEGNVTVMTCWHADRLDLGRCGIVPQTHRLCTSAGRATSIRQWAHQRAQRQLIPQLIRQEWGLNRWWLPTASSTSPSGR